MAYSLGRRTHILKVVSSNYFGQVVNTCAVPSSIK